MNFGVYLAHGDAELTWLRYSHGVGQRESIDEGSELKNVQHGHVFAWGVGDWLLSRRHLMHVVHLGEAAGTIEEAKGGSLLQEAATGRAGIGQRVGSRVVWLAKKARTPLGSACFQRYKVNVTAM